MRLLPLALVCSFAFASNEPLFEARSAYSHIVVTESPSGVRHLKFDDITQSSVKLGDAKQLIHEYTQTSMVGWAFPKAVIDVVDVDAAVVDVAKKFFESAEAGPATLLVNSSRFGTSYLGRGGFTAR